MVVVGASRIALSCTLGTADLSINGTSFDVGDLPLGFLAANNSGGTGDCSGLPVLHEVHSGSVHLEAVVAIGSTTSVSLTVVVVRRTVAGGELGDAEGLSASLAGSRREAVSVDLGLSATGLLLGRAVLGGPGGGAPRHVVAQSRARVGRAGKKGVLHADHLRGLEVLRVRKLVLGGEELRAVASAAKVVLCLRDASQRKSSAGEAGRVCRDGVGALWGKIGGVELRSSGGGDADLVPVSVGPEGLGLTLSECAGLQLGEEGRVPVGTASDGHADGAPGGELAGGEDGGGAHACGFM